MKTNTISFLSSYLLLAALICLLFTGTTCIAEEPPIQIEADQMTSLEKSRSVIFTGNVDAKQGDVRIRAKKMTVYYSEGKPGKTGKSKKSKSAQQVEKVTCEGDVEITSEDWLGTSDIMHYYSKKSLVQLIGNAKAFKGQNKVKGERINYYLDTGKSEVFGGTDVKIDGDTAESKKPSRVNMTILEQ